MRSTKIFAAVSALFMSGCAALLNSDRPRYTGPIRAAAWHAPGLSIEKTPVIHHGVVYAIARPIEGPPEPRVFAFDLKSGRKLWHSSLRATEILCVAGGAIYTISEGSSQIAVMDAQTGARIVAQPPFLFSKATAYESVLYLADNGSVAARSLSIPGQSAEVWRVAIPLTNPQPPVAAGGIVYVYGFTPSEILSNKIGRVGVYAFDAKSGAALWKWEHPGNIYDNSVIVENVSADPATAFVWTKDTSSNVFGAGILTAFDALTGWEKWKHRTSPYAQLAGQPLLFDPHAAVIAEYPAGKNSTAESSGFIYRAFDRASGAPLWASQNNWKYKQMTTLDGLLLASDAKVHEVLNENNDHSPDSWLSAVDIRSGKELWRSATLELGVFTIPAAAEGMVVVGSKPFTCTNPPRKGQDDVAGLWAWEASR